MVIGLLLFNLYSMCIRFMMFQDLRSARVTLIIRSAGVGGAERQCLLTAELLTKIGIDVEVLLFYTSDDPKRQFSIDSSVKVVNLDKKGRWSIISFIFNLWRYFHDRRPHFVYSFMDSAIIASSIFQILYRETIFISGVRDDPNRTDINGAFPSLMHALALKFAMSSDAIICNSSNAKGQLIERGFRRSDIVVIPNGIDSDYFSFDFASRIGFRNKNGFSNNDVIVAIVGRICPVKRQLDLIQATKILQDIGREVFLVIVGGSDISTSDYLKQCVDEVSRLNMSKHIKILGLYDNVRSVYCGADLLVSCSASEGFSNVIAEGMSTGLHVICTNVGDNSSIVSSYGRIVPVGQPSVLATAIDSMIPSLRAGRNANGRKHIESCFGVRRLSLATCNVFVALKKRKR